MSFWRKDPIDVIERFPLTELLKNQKLLAGWKINLEKDMCNIIYVNILLYKITESFFFSSQKYQIERESYLWIISLETQTFYGMTKRWKVKTFNTHYFLEKQNNLVHNRFRNWLHLIFKNWKSHIFLNNTISFSKKNSNILKQLVRILLSYIRTNHCKE